MSTKQKKSDELQAVSPVYLAGRREWNERYGDYIAQARSWRIAAIGALSVAAVSVCGTVWLATQSHVVPYVVEVNHLGDQLAIQRANVASPADPRVIRSDLSRWIEDTRSIYSDPLAERRVVTEAYAFVNKASSASVEMNNWFTGTLKPFDRAKDETISVAVESVLPISGKVWRIEWRQTTRSKTGGGDTVRQWEATVTISIRPPTTDAQILANPLGVYIDNFSWSSRT